MYTIAYKFAAFTGERAVIVDDIQTARLIYDLLAESPVYVVTSPRP